MPSITTVKFRVMNAKAMKTAILSGESNSYLAIGRQLPWVDEIYPPVPEDVEGDFAKLWSDLLAAKRIQENEVVLSAPRYDWISGGIYLPFYTVENPKFYVMTDEYKVYRCLDSYGQPSMNKPTSTSTTPFRQPDGYLWKYMFTISTADALRFLTEDFLPVRDDPIVKAAANPGEITSMQIISGGSGYTTANVVIDGDGTGASASAMIVGGEISRIVMNSFGQDYTVANITITGDGIGADVKAILSPAGGFGFDVESELIATNVTISCELFENLPDFPTVNDYRRIILMTEPALWNSTTLASGPTYTCSYAMKIEKVSGADGIPTDATAIGVTSGCRVSFVSADLVSDIPLTYVVRYTRDLTTPHYKHPALNEEVTLVGGGTWKVIETYHAGTNPLLHPELQPGSGNIVFIEQRRPIMRAPEQSEIIIVQLMY